LILRETVLGDQPLLLRGGGSGDGKTVSQRNKVVLKPGNFR
jgi:hypothetical protein